MFSEEADNLEQSHQFGGTELDVESGEDLRVEAVDGGGSVDSIGSNVFIGTENKHKK